jgi:hypothetical protein
VQSGSDMFQEMKRFLILSPTPTLRCHIRYEREDIMSERTMVGVSKNEVTELFPLFDLRDEGVTKYQSPNPGNHREYTLGRTTDRLN